MPEWVPIPSAFAIYGILYKLFDLHIWKWKLLNRMGVIFTPDMSGDWEMTTYSSVTDYLIPYSGNLKISQTWNKISLYLDGEKFIGTSTMASFDMRTKKSFSLKWEYLSQKKPEFSDQDYMHYGMTRILKEEGSESISGDYYTDRSRHSYGKVTLIKKA